MYKNRGRDVRVKKVKNLALVAALVLLSLAVLLLGLKDRGRRTLEPGRVIEALPQDGSITLNGLPPAP